MTCHGRIHNGRIELDEELQLPEGCIITCLILPASEGPAQTEAATGKGRDALLALAGTVAGWPEDASEKVDHYVYGNDKV